MQPRFSWRFVPHFLVIKLALKGFAMPMNVKLFLFLSKTNLFSGYVSYSKKVLAFFVSPFFIARIFQ